MQPYNISRLMDLSSIWVPHAIAASFVMVGVPNEYAGYSVIINLVDFLELDCPSFSPFT
jgi:hypothetical protein